MGNGYSSGKGTDELWCGTPRPESPEDSTNSSTGFVGTAPNVAAGNDGDWFSSNIRRSAGASSTNDHLSIGSNDIDTEDFSMEFWIRRLFPDSITNWQTSAAAATGYCVTGIADGDNSTNAPNFVAGSSGAQRHDAAGIQVRGANFEAFYQEIGTTFVSRTFTLGFGWHHVAVTYDRSGNMETYVDGTSFGTDAINTTALNFFTGIAQFCNTTGQAANSGKAEVPYLLAGFALHVGLLTDAQILNSVRNVTLQDLGDSTFWAYFYSDIRLRESTTGATPLTTTAIYTTSTRSALSTVIADLRLPVVEITAANTDLSNGGVAGAIQPVDGGGGNFAVIPLRTTGTTPPASGSLQDISLLGEGNYEMDETDHAHFSPALVHDPSWPPMRGTSGTDYA